MNTTRLGGIFVSTEKQRRVRKRPYTKNAPGKGSVLRSCKQLVYAPAPDVTLFSTNWTMNCAIATTTRPITA